MAEIGAWNGHQFIVSPTLIRGFTGLSIKGWSETEDMESGGQKYVSRKSSKPYEISLTVELNAFTGCAVQTEALKFVEEANNGAKNYFYLGGKKLIACQLMLTEASVTEMEISPSGKWTRCKVKLTMKQCAKYDGTESYAGGGGVGGSGGGNSSGSSKYSIGSTSLKYNTPSGSTTAAGSVVGAIVGTVTGVSSAINNVAYGLAAAVAAVNKAQSASYAQKNTSGLGSVANKISTGIKKVISK